MKKYPFVTLIMPIRNEGNFIARSLGALLQQDYPHEYMEVIITDGMSDDNTREIVGQLKTNSDVCISMVDNHKRIVSTGMNAALTIARGEIIIRVDGHVVVASNYIRNCVQALLQGKADCVGGPMETICDTTAASAIAIAMSSKFGVGGVAFRTGVNEQRYVDTVAFGAYTHEVIKRAGFFDEELIRNQDDEYNYRLRKFGAKILLTPEIRSRYYSRSSLHSLWWQYFQYGYWKVRVMQKHSRQMSPRQFAPPTFVASLLFSLLLALFSRVGIVALGLICGSYLLANMVATISTWRRSEKSDGHVMLLLPVCFVTLHLAYGMGFLIALIKFWNRWVDQRSKASLPTTELP